MVDVDIKTTTPQIIAVKTLNSSGGGGAPATVIITAEEIEGGHRLSIIDSSGTTKTVDVMDGKDGEKGDRGETGQRGETGDAGVSATHEWNGTTLTVTSASGTSSADLKGEKGDRGERGETGAKGDPASWNDFTAEQQQSVIDGVLEAALDVEVPTKVSQLENDAGYLTEHQSLSGLATKDDLSAKQDKLTPKTGEGIYINYSNEIGIGRISMVQVALLEESLNLKQNKLKAGDNITIDANNRISATGGISQSDLDGINAQIATKANVSHTHSMSEVVNLTSTLAGKAPLQHRHDASDISGLEVDLSSLDVGEYDTFSMRNVLCHGFISSSATKLVLSCYTGKPLWNNPSISFNSITGGIRKANGGYFSDGSVSSNSSNWKTGSAVSSVSGWVENGAMTIEIQLKSAVSGVTNNSLIGGYMSFEVSAKLVVLEPEEDE